MTRYGAVPTLGFPSQSQAIVAFYESGLEPKMIAARVGVSINAVYRAITDYRRATGRQVEPTIRLSPDKTAAPLQPEGVWAKNADDRRRLFHRRAVRAAHVARMANA